MRCSYALTARQSLIGIIRLACWLSVTMGLQDLRAADKDATGVNQQPTILEYSVKLEIVMSGFDGKTCWVAPRAGVVPGAKPSVVFEPSLVRYRERFYLTMRNDRAAYVATSEDGQQKPIGFQRRC